MVIKSGNYVDKDQMFTFAVLSIESFFFFHRILIHYWDCVQTQSTYLISLPSKKTFQAKPKFFSIPVQERQTQSKCGLNLS